MSARSRQLPPIVCGVDNAYAGSLAVLMTSLANSHPGDRCDLRVIVLHHELAAEHRNALARVADQRELDLQLRCVTPAAGTRPISGWISNAAYLRLAIADMVPDEPIVLYLDSDILICGDLRPLLLHDLERFPLAAVRDPQNPVLGNGIALPGWRRIGLTAGGDYFNSGVMLLDLPRCRDEGVFDRAEQFLANHPDEAGLWDQDALNVAADGRWLRLDRRWNTFALSPLASLPDFVHYAEAVMPLRMLLSDEDTAAVLHFAGPLKPWQDNYPPSPLRDRYLSTRAHVEGVTR